MFGHPVIDQTIHRHALDVLAVLIYALAFVAIFAATRKRAAFGVVLA